MRTPSRPGRKEDGCGLLHIPRHTKRDLALRSLLRWRECPFLCLDLEQKQACEGVIAEQIWHPFCADPLHDDPKFPKRRDDVSFVRVPPPGLSDPHALARRIFRTCVADKGGMSV